MCHIQWDDKVWNNRVKCGVKQSDRKVSMTKKVKTEMIRANYVQRIKHRVIVQLHIRDLKEKYGRRIHRQSLRMMRKHETK